MVLLESFIAHNVPSRQLPFTRGLDNGKYPELPRIGYKIDQKSMIPGVKNRNKFDQ